MVPSIDERGKGRQTIHTPATTILSWKDLQIDLSSSSNDSIGTLLTTTASVVALVDR